jgi:hypothetical protein
MKKYIDHERRLHRKVWFDEMQRKLIYASVEGDFIQLVNYVDSRSISAIN